MSRGARRLVGVTIVELFVALSMVVVILFGIMQVFEPSTLAYPAAQRTFSIQRTGRTAIDVMAKQIRMAGYFPENADTIPGNDQSHAVELATNNALAVAGDLDGSGVSNTFLYCLDGVTLRRVQGPRGSPSSYSCRGGSVLAEGVDRLAFAYYDRNNDPVPNPATSAYELDGQGLGGPPAFTTTTERLAVRRVAITLSATETVPNQPPQRYTLTSDVRLRNP